MLDELQAAERLTSNDNIAIVALSVICILEAAAIVALWAASVKKDKTHAAQLEAQAGKFQTFIEKLVANFREDLNHVFASIDEFTKALYAAATDIAVIRDRAERRRAGRDG